MAALLKPAQQQDLFEDVRFKSIGTDLDNIEPTECLYIAFIFMVFPNFSWFSLHFVALYPPESLIISSWILLYYYILLDLGPSEVQTESSYILLNPGQSKVCSSRGATCPPAPDTCAEKFPHMSIGGPSGRSSVRRPGREDPHRHEQILLHVIWIPSWVLFKLSLDVKPNSNI